MRPLPHARVLCRPVGDRQRLGRPRARQLNYGSAMTPGELAAELGVSPTYLRAWLRRTWTRPERGSRWKLTPQQIDSARERWRHQSQGGGAWRSPPSTVAARGRRREDSDEAYVLDLLDELIGTPGQRQARFPWLVGDPGVRGMRAQLPVDGYWLDRRLVVEYRERQHDEPTPFFDKPSRMTASGIHRGEQRRRYDQRRDHEIPAHGLRLLVVRPSDLASVRGRLRRRSDEDRSVLADLLAGANGPRS